MKDKNDKLKKDDENEEVFDAVKDNQPLTIRIQKYVEENSKKVMIISGAVIVIVALIFVVRNFMEKKAEENRIAASLKISRVMPFYLQGEFKKALDGEPNARIRNEKIAGFVEIVDQYSGTEQAKYAAIYAAQAYLSLNQVPQAEKYFKIALDSKAGIVQEGANAGLGVCKEIENNFKEAAEYYSKAAQIAANPASKGKYQYFQALSLEKTGDKEGAEKLYREIILENKSDFVGSAKQSLTRLGMIIE